MSTPISELHFPPWLSSLSSTIWLPNLPGNTAHYSVIELPTPSCSLEGAKICCQPHHSLQAPTPPALGSGQHWTRLGGSSNRLNSLVRLLLVGLQLWLDICGNGQKHRGRGNIGEEMGSTVSIGGGGWIEWGRSCSRLVAVKNRGGGWHCPVCHISCCCRMSPPPSLRCTSTLWFTSLSTTAWLPNLPGNHAQLFC